MRKAHLPAATRDRVVCSPEVGDQDPLDRLCEERRKRWRASGTIDHVERRLGGAEAPQPPGLAHDAPAGFIGAEYAGGLHHLTDLFMPGPQDVGDPVRVLDDAPLADGELKVGVQDRLDLRKGDSQAEAQPRDEYNQTMPEGRSGQGIGHRGLDYLPAGIAVVPWDRVLDRFRLCVFRDVLDDPCARGLLSPAAREIHAVAVGATSEAMRFGAIDTWRNRTAGPRMPGFRSALGPSSLPSARGGFLVNRRGRGGRGGSLAQSSESSGELQQNKDSLFRVVQYEFLGLFMAKLIVETGDILACCRERHRSHHTDAAQEKKGNLPFCQTFLRPGETLQLVIVHRVDTTEQYNFNLQKLFQLWEIFFNARD